MRILQIAPRLCWPLDTGAKLRNYHLARVLARQASVTLLAFINQEKQPTGSLDFYDSILTVARNSGYSFSKIVRGLFGSTPLPILNYTTEAMKRAVKGLLDAKDFDVVQIESIHLMKYLPIIRAERRRPLVVCDWHNIESELMRQYAEREQSVLRRTYARRTARLMSEAEKHALREFDAHIVVSEQDADRLRSLNSDARVYVVENGVDTTYYSEVSAAAGDESIRNRIVFVGSMDYHANIDGVVSFARDMWPQVRARKPELIFTIVGKDPAAEVRELASISGVEVTGTVDDVRPYYREAAASIVPLRVGGGSRLKILESMAAGVPVISTTLGGEGLDVHDGKDILIANDKAQFIDAILSVVESESRRQQLIAGGRSLVSERYDWSGLGANLFKIYQQLIDFP